MITIYKILSTILGIISIMMMEVMINSTLFGQVIGMGVGYLVAGSFWVIFISTLILEGILFFQEYKVKVGTINICIIFISVVFGLVNLIYNPINPETYSYEPEQWYIVIQIIYNLIFYGLLVFKSGYIVMNRIVKR
jgi:hypothetical protein